MHCTKLERMGYSVGWPAPQIIFKFGEGEVKNEFWRTFVGFVAPLFL